MKRLLLIIPMAVAILLFSSCSCKHEWKEATCTTAKKCTICGEREGKKLGHKWLDATCISPQVCAVCGEENGEQLDHIWSAATCIEKSTCSVCGEVKGDFSSHDWIPASVDAPKTCKVCNTTEGGPLIAYNKVTQYVVDGYDSALEYASKNNTEVDYAYNDVRERLVKINSAAYTGDLDAAQWAAFRVLNGEITEMSLTELQNRAQKAMKFILPENSDRFGALMKQFSTMSSVSGTVSSTEVNIVVEDMDAFVEEIGLEPEIVGGILAITKMYDYSWIDSSSNDFLQFTETGFAFQWKAVGDYKLNLGA